VIRRVNIRADCQRVPIMCRSHEEIHMRTNVVIDDTLMAEVLQATAIKTKREAVERGLQTLLQLHRQADIRQLRGQVAWAGDLDTMRQDGPQ
jgi:Arc/MetJ family transcription regulator